MKVSTKQICLLLFALIPASKFLILPSVYANLAAQDSWFAGLINCILDGGMLAVMLLIIKKFKGMSFYEVLSFNFGKVTAKIVYFIYFLYFMLKGTVPLFEQKNFTEITLYETSPTVFTFLPFFLVCFYLCVKGLRTMARTGEIVFWFTAVAFCIIIFLSIGTFRPYYLMPVLKNPLKRTLTAIYSGAMWYGQPIILLFLMGGIKIEKRFNLKIALSFISASLVCVLMFAIFTGIYGDISARQIYAITRMTKYSIALSNVGRFDFVATLLLSASAVLSLSAPLIFAVECLRMVFGSKRIWLLSLIVNAAMLAVLYFFRLYYQAVADMFERYFSPAMIALVYVLPPFVLLLRRNKNALCKE